MGGERIEGGRGVADCHPAVAGEAVEARAAGVDDARRGGETIGVVLDASARVNGRRECRRSGVRDEHRGEAVRRECRGVPPPLLHRLDERERIGIVRLRFQKRDVGDERIVDHASRAEHSGDAAGAPGGVDHEVRLDGTWDGLQPVRTG